MFNWLGISAINPALLWGALAVASPIIIHLLSKRRFRIVEWAAMDFLLEAEKRNRRRVRLEQLILLLLRCLAILLIALLVARPFSQSQGLASMLMTDASFERVIVLDDSPSMQLQAEGKITFDETKKGLVAFLRDLSRERTRDTVTIRLTSKPDSPIVSGQNLTADGVESIVQAIENQPGSDLSANLGKALLEVERSFEDRSGPTNRVVYLVTDFRKRDWGHSPPPPTPPAEGAAAPVVEAPAAAPSPEQDVPGIIKRISAKASEFIVLDIGLEAQENLSITDIRSINKALVKGIESEFSVLVRNTGTTTVSDVEVTFAAGESLELKSRVDAIAAGEEIAVPFRFKFEETGSVPITASVGADPLKPDNTRHFAARVRDGVQVLLVNGDPSTDHEHSEVYYLKQALRPRGLGLLGFTIDEVSESQFEGLELSKFQVIIVCNLYRVSEDRQIALDKWVKAGGGLIVFLGDQVDEEIYNAQLYRDGKGLLPARLEGMRGDETERKWVGLNIEDMNHVVFGNYSGDLTVLISQVKVFRWWHTVVDDKAVKAGRIAVPLRLTSDADSAPAFIEQTYGDGKVVMVTTACDADWNNWPGSPSYLPTIGYYTEYMARNTVGEGTLSAGTPIVYDLDAAKYLLDARIVPKLPGAPEAEVVPVQAEPVEDGKRLLVSFDGTQRVGFYNLELTTRDAQSVPVLFATNIEAGEGQLERADDADVKKRMGEANNVKWLKGNAALTAGAVGARSEFWRTILFLLVAVLCIEQFLAWSFGRRRY
jgi:hypothetical protein